MSRWALPFKVLAPSGRQVGTFKVPLDAVKPGFTPAEAAQAFIDRRARGCTVQLDGEAIRLDAPAATGPVTPANHEGEEVA